ncbi:hypothetical protein LAZ67_19001662 [Cordylochernes scorpioides]|uniref:Retroviral polymerase SH3-like domain-containing protein n=1 Tax=Cordylochernes scorpioides TaxID=51811 RepID=A0ABY6LJJ4_9ARAC|nr:hypothetical protein LAZ67_19001662 [Cordylochernes scorpioides]
MWTERPVKIEHIRVFGCQTWAYNDQRRSKFDSRSRECVLIGYPEGVKGYKVLHNNFGEDYESINEEETKLVERNQKDELKKEDEEGQNEAAIPRGYSGTDEETISVEKNLNNMERREDGEQAYEDEALSREDEEGQNETIIPRRSSRIAARQKEYCRSAFHHGIIEHKSHRDEIPSSYDEALNMPKAQDRLKSIECEMASLQEHRSDYCNPFSPLLPDTCANIVFDMTNSLKFCTSEHPLKKTPAKFIPKFLTNEQKLCRLATCEDMLEMTRTDPEWKDKIITGDETWVYGYNPETNRQSTEWTGQAETSAFLAETKDSRIADSGATDHMTFRREWFSTFEYQKVFILCALEMERRSMQKVGVLESNFAHQLLPSNDTFLPDIM